MKKHSTILLLFLLSLAVSAQQVGMVSHYFFKPLVYNPAFTGYDGNTNAMIISHQQWTGFHGAPQLNIFTLDGSLASKKVGLGVEFISDRKGITNRVGGDLKYSYKLKINDHTDLHFGISAGIIDQSIDYSKAMVEDNSDPTLFTGNEHKTTFDANAGLALVWKRLEFGVSAPQLFGNRINYPGDSGIKSYYTQNRHYLSILKYTFLISKAKEISLTPQAIVRYLPNAPLEYEGTLNFGWQEKVWIGASYKSGYALTACAGVCLYKMLSIGYAYDIIMGPLSNSAGISHEVMVNFKFGKTNKKDENLPQKDEVKTKENNYQDRLDSLQSQIDANLARISQDQQKIKELNDKLEQQKVTKTQSSEEKIKENNHTSNTASPVNTGNQSVSTVKESNDKLQENGIWFVNSKATDYRDRNNKVPQEIYYVIAGTFVYKDFAETEVKRLRSTGLTNTDMIFFIPKQYNYVFIFKTNSKEEAINFAKRNAKNFGINDAWVLQLAQ